MVAPFLGHWSVVVPPVVSASPMRDCGRRCPRSRTVQAGDTVVCARALEEANASRSEGIYVRWGRRIHAPLVPNDSNFNCPEWLATSVRGTIEKNRPTVTFHLWLVR